MKPLLKKSVDSPIHSFMIKELIEPFFDPNWHFHPHYQLFTVLEGTGTRFIGDDISHFEAGDTVFVGPNLPHLWRSDKVYFEPHSSLKTHGIVVYFSEDFLGKDFFEKQEMILIKNLFKESLRGLNIVGQTRLFLQKALKDLTQKQGFEGILNLLTILHQFSKSTDYEAIASIGYTNTHKISETNRMQKVHEYVLKHFKEEIKLGEIASLVSMSEAAFCRYFKSRTNKTFSEFVAEIRIGHACKLLLKDNKTIAQISFESGYHTLSNFNKQFREIIGTTPHRYQKEYLSSR
jgi:AraC-like DNA-binding protein